MCFRRTCDNVELVLDVTFFWAVVDCQKMILHTDDAPGDICHHARSMIIEAVSQIDLKSVVSCFVLPFFEGICVCFFFWGGVHCAGAMRCQRHGRSK